MIIIIENKLKIYQKRSANHINKLALLLKRREKWKEWKEKNFLKKDFLVWAL